MHSQIWPSSINPLFAHGWAKDNLTPERWWHTPICATRNLLTYFGRFDFPATALVSILRSSELPSVPWAQSFDDKTRAPYVFFLFCIFYCVFAFFLFSLWAKTKAAHFSRPVSQTGCFSCWP